MRTALTLVALLYITFLFLLGCSTSQLPFLYRPDMEQGTVLEEEKVKQLRPGMTPQQVRFLLGTPTIQDPFHNNRWDYVYMNDPRDGEATVQHRLTLFFDAADHLQAAQGYAIPPDSPLRRPHSEDESRLSSR